MLQEKKKKNTFVAENAENMQGEMLEWLKRHAWKACIRQKCIAGSNPALSAEYETILCYAGFFSFVFQLCTYLNFSQNFSVFSQKFFS